MIDIERGRTRSCRGSFRQRPNPECRGRRDALFRCSMQDLRAVMCCAFLCTGLPYMYLECPGTSPPLYAR